MTIETISEHACFGGVQGFYRHASRATGTPMQFSVFRPASPAGQALPTLFYLAGLTCTEETFAIKAGAQRVAAELGLMLIAPDTSPRRTGIAGEDADWEFGSGAGFYLDATVEPWSRHFRMESYVCADLHTAAVERFGADPARCGLFGHSMGGHGALTLALRHPGQYRSLSAFAPIAAPSDCPWGRKAFGGFLGADPQVWKAHDASALMREAHCPFPDGILIDQGLADKFLASQLHPEAFEAACVSAGQPLTLRRHAGYDHGYFFIASFVEDHLRFHARNLGRGGG
ncbi:MAG: S-formylglutathione hydrolase [Burkholderiales bacterium]|nr:S-formylglutathione hydrolase [Burkholderiales bacterium]